MLEPARASKERQRPLLPFDRSASPSDLGRSATPFLKWAGGKGQLLAKLHDFLPEKFGTYFETFVGGGALFFYLRRIRGQFPAVLTDSNRELIDCYKVVRDKVEALIRALRIHKEHHGKVYYYTVRDEMHLENLDAVQRAARVIYLNKTCYNGLYRVNSKGQFNVPIGSYDNPTVLDESNLRAASKALEKVTLRCADFSEVRAHAERNDLVYFDPPYYLRRSGFTSYAVHQFGGFLGGADFGADEHDRLMRVARRLAKRGCRVIISNSSADYVQRLYEGFDVHQVKARRYINSDGDRRFPVDEFVIKNR